MQVGDMVWGKVKSHPWWPGEIYNEAFASDAVRQKKKEGYVLVSFYGDYSYSWFDPAELIPFDLHYEEKSKQTNSPDFMKAVDHAFYEVSKRAALGFACSCRSTFQPTNVEGFVKVDVCGYDPGALYSTDQIKTARNGFQPLGILSFIKKLALSPTNDLRRDIDLTKNVAGVLAYRSSVFEEFDETYAQAFGVKPIRPGSSMVVSIQGGNELTQGTSSFKESSHHSVTQVPLGYVIPELPNKNKVGAKKTNKNILERRDKQNVEDSAAQSIEFKTQVKSKQSRKRVKLNEPEKKEIAPLAASIPQAKPEKIAKRVSSVGEKEKETIAMNNKEPAKVSSFDDPTMLYMKFPRGSRLPSTSELKAKFARFGPLETSSARVYWNSSTCRLIFLQKRDAESAYNYMVNGNIFGDTNVSFRLVELDNATENVPVNSCLKNKNLGVGSTSASTEDSLVKRLLGEHKSIEEFVHAVNMKHLQLKEMNSRNNQMVATASSTGGVDISAQMISLLTKCSEIVADMKCPWNL